MPSHINSSLAVTWACAFMYGFVWICMCVCLFFFSLVFLHSLQYSPNTEQFNWDFETLSLDSYWFNETFVTFWNSKNTFICYDIRESVQCCEREYFFFFFEIIYKCAEERERIRVKDRARYRCCLCYTDTEFNFHAPQSHHLSSETNDFTFEFSGVLNDSGIPSNLD